MDARFALAREYLLSEGAQEVGFGLIPDAPGGLTGAISFVIRLSNAVVDQISDRPTEIYFHHYRTVNAMIDRMTLGCGILLQKMGVDYLPIAASQSIGGYQGAYSHKKAAVLCGLGTIGRNGLFLHPAYGPRVRLGALFTDLQAPPQSAESSNLCRQCRLCVQSCPACAILGREFDPQSPDQQLIDPVSCSEYMKRNFQKIGRGAVCGICMRVCPVGQKDKVLRSL